ncbi:MAG: hypothetical protein NTV34_02200 [Proteobacteria bacterium]|nr:hypothetical protein [Pseudomonadota bacterium]
MANKTFKILIVGGGSGGISLAARLDHAGFEGQIGLLEPREHHHYQPLWTLVGAGIVSNNVFGIGDVTGNPNSKTGAGIRKQAPIVARNVVRFLKGELMDPAYDGYSSCPLITGIGKVILAEFGYDGKLLPSFPLEPIKERRIYWILKKDLLPLMYWHGMLKGYL